MLKNEIVQLKSYDEKTGKEIGNVLPITNSEAVKVENDKNLKQTLVDMNDKIEQTNESLDKKANKNELQAIASGSPKGVFSTLALLQADVNSNTTEGRKYTYVINEDGKWYYWSGDLWTAGGIYQASKMVSDSNISTQTTFSSANIIENLYGNKSITYGYTGSDTTYAGANTTRINNIQLVTNVLIESIVFHINKSSEYKILELTKNNDGTFSLKQIIKQGISSVGLNNVKVDNIIANAGSYIGFFSKTGGVSYGSKGRGFVFNGDLTGTNATVTESLFSFNYLLNGKSVGVDYVKDMLNNIENGIDFQYGNTLGGTNDIPLGQTRIIDEKIKHDGLLKNVNLSVSSNGNAILLELKKLSNGNFAFVKKLANITLTSGINNIELNKTLVNKGNYIGYYSTTSSLKYDSNGSSFSISGFANSDNMVSNISTAKPSFNLIISKIGLSTLSQEVFSDNKSDNLSNVIFDIGSTITSDFYNSGGWLNNLSPENTNEILYFNKSTSLDIFTAYTDITLREVNTKLALITKAQPNHNNTNIYVSIDFGTKKIAIHEGWNGNVEVIPNIIKEDLIPFDINIGDGLILEISKNTVQKLTVTIKNKKNAKTFSITNDVFESKKSHGIGCDGFGIIHKQGSYYRNRMVMKTNQTLRPFMAIYGDSIIEGNNLSSNYGVDNKYSMLIKKSLNDNCVISGRGGETSAGIIEKLNIDFKLFRPKYTLLAIGTNDNILNIPRETYVANLKVICDFIVANNSIPILANFVYTTYQQGYSDLVKTFCDNNKYCLYDYRSALTTNGYNADVELLLDGVHPNIEGHKRAFEKFKIDCEFVYDDYYSNFTPQ